MFTVRWIGVKISKSINEAIGPIEELTSGRRSPTQVRWFLPANLGMKRPKVEPISVKASTEKQPAFLGKEFELGLEETQ